MAVAHPTRALFNGCDPEETKIVETTSSSYGNKTAMYAYERAIDIWCGSVANTTLWFLGGTYYDFFEAGTRQYYNSPGSVRPFMEYRFYPAQGAYVEAGPISSRQWLAFQTLNSSGTSYYLTAKWGYGLVPASYDSLGTTPYAPSNFGLPMSEISRYGHSDVNVSLSVDSMKYRTSTGSWPYWPGLRCNSYVPDTIPDWDGVKLSDYSWETQHHAIVAGGC
jgi:hypothetical protein